MSQSPDLELFKAYAQAFVERKIIPLLSNKELRQYKMNSSPPSPFPLTPLEPYTHRLIANVTSQIQATVLDAIIVQALFGRARMMDQKWFKDVYQEHGTTLDEFPRDAPSEFLGFQAAIFGRAGRCCEPPPPSPETTTTATRIRSTEDLLALLQAKIEQINTLENKQHKDLEDLFGALAKSYPELKGVLCGVRHSFRGRDDRCAERAALWSATSEYIEEMELQGEARKIHGRALAVLCFDI